MLCVLRTQVSLPKTRETCACFFLVMCVCVCVLGCTDDSQLCGVSDVAGRALRLGGCEEGRRGLESGVHRCVLRGLRIPTSLVFACVCCVCVCCVCVLCVVCVLCMLCVCVCMCMLCVCVCMCMLCMHVCVVCCVCMCVLCV